MVHHSSAALGAHAWPGPAGVYARGIRVWLRHAYKRADVVMSACDPSHDTRRPAAMPLRLGLHPAFVPRPDVDRSGHVLYVGRLVREKGIFALLQAAAASPTPWRLRMIGSGPAEALVRSRARRLGIAERLEIRPFIASPEALAREYAAASCVVMPGPFETLASPRLGSRLPDAGRDLRNGPVSSGDRSRRDHIRPGDTAGSARAVPAGPAGGRSVRRLYASPRRASRGLQSRCARARARAHAATCTGAPAGHLRRAACPLSSTRSPSGCCGRTGGKACARTGRRTGTRVPRRAGTSTSGTGTRA